MEAEDGVHRLDLPRPDRPPAYSKVTAGETIDEPIGVHVLEGDTVILFGTGYADSADELLAWLDGFGGVDVVVVEHGDPDHYGAVAEVLGAYESTVAIPADDAGALTNVDVEPDVELRDGDHRWGLDCVHVPGHTPGNMSFLAGERLIAGDTVVHAKSAIAAPGEWGGALAPIRPGFNADDEAARRNIRRLAEHTFETAYLTHGPDVLTGARREVDRLIDDLGG